MPKWETYSNIKTPYRYIRVRDIDEGKINDSLLYLSKNVQAKIAKYIVNEGNVIITIAGSIGLIAIVEKEHNGCNLTENAAKIVIKDDKILNKFYLAEILKSKNIIEKISFSVVKSTIPKLALFRIKDLIIPLPPINVQNKIEVKLKIINKLKTIEKIAIDTEQKLLLSLYQKLFTMN